MRATRASIRSSPLVHDDGVYVEDPISGDRLIVARSRSLRPDEFRGGGVERCPFCPGNEPATPPEIARIPRDGTWLARAFANKFPIVAPPAGRHEVIVDSPSHEREFSAAGIALWRQRYAALATSFVPVLFKNAGLQGGATLRHPHTQIVGLDRTPPRLQRLLENSAAGSCSICDDMQVAPADGRWVCGSGELAAYVPPVDRFGALTVTPRRHATDFSSVSDAMLIELTTLLERLHDGMRRAAPPSGPSMNVLLYALPERAGFLHWNLALIERRNTLAGFELTTNLYVRSVSSQESAERWRQLLDPSC